MRGSGYRPYSLISTRTPPPGLQVSQFAPQGGEGGKREPERERERQSHGARATGTDGSLLAPAGVDGKRVALV